MRNTGQILLALAAALLLGAGCSQKTLNSADQDTQHNVAVVDQKAKQIGDSIKPDVKKLDVAAPVTAAITINPNLHGTSIRVDGAANGVRLRGTVKMAEQKRVAEEVAQNALKPGQTVDNELTVAPN
jgi:osmotically-inducible protein OsmY